MAAQFLLGWICPPGRMELTELLDRNYVSGLCISPALSFNYLVAHGIPWELESLFNPPQPVESVFHPSAAK